MTLRDANRGGCAQSCRWKYHLMQNEQEISKKENLFSMSSKDLQAVDEIQNFIQWGVRSLKIEGRMKSAYYLATVVSSYRRLIDEIYAKGTVDETFLDEIKFEISKAENRETGPGFYKGLPNYQVQLYQDHDETVTQEYVAYVKDVLEDKVVLQVKNKFTMDDQLEIFGPHIKSTEIQLDWIYDTNDLELKVCNQPMQIIYTKWQGPKEVGAMIRKRRKRNEIKS